MCSICLYIPYLYIAYTRPYTRTLAPPPHPPPPTHPHPHTRVYIYNRRAMTLKWKKRPRRTCRLRPSTRRLLSRLLAGILSAYVSSYYYMCSHTTMCPHTTMYVSSYYYIYVLILLYVSSYYYACVYRACKKACGGGWMNSSLCPHSTIFFLILLCVLILLRVCI